MEWDTWQEQLAEVRALDVLTVERITRLRKLATSRVIRVRGKLRDAVPATTQDGEETVRLVLCDLWRGRDIADFVLPPADAADGSAWARWDRVSWKLRAAVSDHGEVTYEPVFDCLADLERQPGRGPDPFPLTKRKGGPVEFQGWMQGFAPAAYEGHAARAEQKWREGCAKTWIYPATVTAVEDGACLGRLDARAHVDALVKVPAGPDPDFGVRVQRERPVARWGFSPDEELVFAVEDPELLSSLRVGCRVEVAIDLDPEGARSAMRGPFPAFLRVRRVTRR